MTDWLSRLFVKDYGRVNDPKVRVGYGILAGMVGIVLNVALCLAKGVVGLASGSVSIVADAVNNLSDASSNVVSLIGFKLASRPADPGATSTWRRSSYRCWSRRWALSWCAAASSASSGPSRSSSAGLSSW